MDTTIDQHQKVLKKVLEQWAYESLHGIFIKLNRQRGDT
jgi:hypothetical protein